MKRTFYKTVVSFLSIAILLSSVYCVFVNAETAQTASGLKDEVYIDFSKYSVTYTKDKPTWGNVYGGFGEDFYQVKTDDETATGGAYLRLNKTATTAATCKVVNQLQFLLNETGNFGWDVQNPGDADRVVLDNNAQYRITMRYRVSNYANVASSIRMYLTTVNTNVSSGEGNSYNMVDFRITSNTDVWVEKSTTITTPTNIDTSSAQSMALQARPIDSSVNYDGDAVYTIDFDYIKIEKLSTVTLTNRQDEAETTTITDWHKTNFPPYARTYYTSKDDDSSVVDVTGKTLGDFNGQTLYYVDIAGAFTPENNDIDFSGYSVTEGTTVVKGFTDYLTVQSDATLSGGKYLQHKKTSTLASEATSHYQHRFIVSPSGKATHPTNASGLPDQDLVLSTSATYRVTMRYRVSDYSVGGKLAFSFAYTHNANACTNNYNTYQYWDSTKLSITGNTDGWVEQTVYFTTPDTFKGAKASDEATFRYLLLDIYPYDSNGTSYDADSAYTVDFDYVEIDRVSTVNLYDIDESTEAPAKTVVGAPGESLGLTTEYGSKYYFDAQEGNEIVNAANKTFVNLDSQAIYYYTQIDGDVNNDLKVDIRDLVRFKVYLDDSESNSIKERNADIDSTSGISDTDMSALRLILLNN